MRNPLTKEAFAEWCEKQPADAYNYRSCDHCALGQYARALGMDTPYGEHQNAPIYTSKFWQSADTDAFADGCESDWNFHALASRLRA